MCVCGSQTVLNSLPSSLGEPNLREPQYEAESEPGVVVEREREIDLAYDLFKKHNVIHDTCSKSDYESMYDVEVSDEVWVAAVKAWGESASEEFHEEIAEAVERVLRLVMRCVLFV